MLCAEDHLPYQGGQYSNEEFDEIQNSLPRPFGEWNCRHTWHPIIMGVSPRAYTDEQLEQFERFSTEELEIDGRTKTRYEWSQEMRRMETAIRQQKDTATLAAAAGDATLQRQCQGSVNALVKEYERLSDRTGLGPDFRRTYVAGFKDMSGISNDVAKKMSVYDQATGEGERIIWPQAGESITKGQFKELKDHATQNGITLSGFRNSDVDIDLAKSAIDALAKVKRDFPNISGDEKHPLTLKLIGFIRSIDFAGVGNEKPPHIIQLNRDAYRNKEALQSEYGKQTKIRYFVEGTSVSSIVYHEAGHMVSDIYQIDGLSIMKSVLGFGTATETLDFCRKNLSIYGGSSGDEIIAECFSAYYGLNEPPQFVVDFMRKVL